MARAFDHIFDFPDCASETGIHKDETLCQGSEKIAPPEAETEATMGKPRKAPTFGVIAFFAIVFCLGSYFTFASVQGDYGLFRRIQIEAEARLLARDAAALERDVARLRNLTHRLSDEFLDLDLLDQQAREMLGLVRHDEVIIR